MLTYHGNSVVEPELLFFLTAVDDALVEGDESFALGLANAGGTVTPIPPTVSIGTATVTTLIRDNDQLTFNLTQSDHRGH